MNTDSLSEKDRNLLIIDDELEITKALTRQFKKKYTVFSATSAEEGLNIMERENIQVVMSDQRMPGMTGVDFFSKIKDLYPDAIRLLLSGYSDLNAVIKAINEGEIFRYVAKPWNPAELEKIISDAFYNYDLVTQRRKIGEFGGAKSAIGKSNKGK